MDRARRVLAVVDAAVDAFLFWHSVASTIQRLSLLDDVTLKTMGIERQEIVPRVYRAAWAERYSRVEREARLRR